MRMVKGLDRKIQTSCGYDEKKVAQYRDGRFNGNPRDWLCILPITSIAVLIPLIPPHIMGMSIRLLWLQPRSGIVSIDPRKRPRMTRRVVTIACWRKTDGNKPSWKASPAGMGRVSPQAAGGTGIEGMEIHRAARRQYEREQHQLLTSPGS
ncbi:hypothetical protein PCH_Pc12g06990 [Penicillium rubens Wisconsin 54-1255]|uniref:Uncharacterized protein n=1 Tax=Penicillium rubens (strain ATCC 28089 / DSM 1075 / NRRL 1951 / Wisconsin 54-1255) TaxID=500485 RepID=B6H0X7_PENRW|nr:hypothetical protein PCH_Pc12g06990 [Penicillium rubens Wisconsin 54-1255]